MNYRDDASVDTSHVQDRRSTTGGPIPGASGGRGARSAGVYLAAGGGTIGLIAVLLVSLLDSAMTTSSTGALSGQGTSTSQAARDPASNCRTGADANQRADCRSVAAINSEQKYWTAALANNQPSYRKAPTVFFSGSTRAACGNATSAVGPFYCPGDQTVYIDLGFYVSLRRDFGASGGTFAEAYVLAHEYGHRVQHLLAFDTLVGRDRQGAASGSVRRERQADCFAGPWAGSAERTGFIEPLTHADLSDGLNAAAAIGDDRIQQAGPGRARPETFTHGTSAQRQAWFFRGYTSRDPNTCETWSGAL
jgi:predicted metalloprotease